MNLESFIVVLIVLMAALWLLRKPLSRFNTRKMVPSEVSKVSNKGTCSSGSCSGCSGASMCGQRVEIASRRKPR